MRLRRFSDWAEGWLTVERCVPGNRFFRNGIVPDGLGHRRQRQPVAFSGPIDRNGDNSCIVGCDGTCQRTNAAGNEAAKKASRRQIFQPVTGRGVHSAFVRVWVAVASIRNSVQYQQAQKYGRQR